MLIRNVLEIFSAAYDIHVNPTKLDTLRQSPKNFDSKQSIKIVKKIHPVIAQMWGRLSQMYSHVSVFHTLPHKATPLCVGGLFDPNDQQEIIVCILPPFNLTLDILNSVMELTFITEISDSRFWKKTSQDSYQYLVPQKNAERGKRLMEKLKFWIDKSQKANIKI